MKIYIPKYQGDMTIGGGWTFLRNFQKGMARYVEFVDDLNKADIFFIVSASMTDQEEVEEAKSKGRAIVFRVDNVPRKSRNKRGRIYDKMKRFGELADIIVFQSEWAREYAGYLTGTEHSMVINNGVDTDIFNLDDRTPSPRNDRYLYVQFNRDENKRFPEAAYHFHFVSRKNPEAKLTLLGAFSPEMITADFDFFGKENIEYIAPTPDPEVMASIYKDNDILLFPAFADAAPNTVLEARACGLEVQLVNPIGGTHEMMGVVDISLDRMCSEYDALFKLIINTNEDIET